MGSAPKRTVGRGRVTRAAEGDRNAKTYEAILQVVLEILESEGYEGVQVRAVAKRARVSLTTLYRFFPTLDALIVAAMARWMETNGYSGMADPPTHASLKDGLMWVYRQIFEPWERNPGMLEAYHRARTGPGGELLDVQGAAVVEPVARALLEKVDPAYAEDVGHTMTHMICGAIQRFASGELAAVTDILPMLERTLYRLTSDNTAFAAARPPRARRKPQRRKGARGR